MKANELRIGNLVLTDRNNSIKTIVEVRLFMSSVEYISTDTNYKHQSMVDYERLIPIPITEDWLLKFGFEHDSDLVNSLCKSGIWFNVKNMEATFLSQKLRKINYVHELQNIYFSLTGEELTIK
jgi:hypothetical protein